MNLCGEAWLRGDRQAARPGMKIFFTPEAEEQAEVCDTSWRENRPATADLFARELAEAKALVMRVPEIGSLWHGTRHQPVRRVLLKKTDNHVYRARGAPRTRQPKLEGRYGAQPQ